MSKQVTCMENKVLILAMILWMHHLDHLSIRIFHKMESLEKLGHSISKV